VFSEIDASETSHIDRRDFMLEEAEALHAIGAL
jgi:hypothetical protein